MADQKISELTAATSAASADLFNIVQGGTNKKLTVENFLQNLNTPIVVNSAGSTANDFSVKASGGSDVTSFFVDVSANAVGINTPTIAANAKLDVNGNVMITGGYLSLQSTETLNGAGSGLTLATDTAVSLLDVTNGSMTNIALANGTDGQIKTVILAVKPSSASAYTAILAPTTRGGYTSVTFTNLGDAATLMFKSGKWFVVSTNGRTTINGTAFS
jgi:hypothetical protein